MTLVRQAADAARLWLTAEALPLWGTAGVDASGSFHERLHFDGRPDLASPRRMRVQARQLYVYSEATARGWWPEARAAADAGFEALLRDCWARDGEPGFLHTITPDRRPLDLKRDTYDHAFGLFALAWYYKATGASRALSLAHEILDFMEGSLADRANGGFLESLPPALPRRSDPHMHLLEAMLEWSAATGEARFLGIARGMVKLFSDRFFDRETNTLCEFFAANLGPATGAPGQVVAPGHHFEWSWLLAWAGRQNAGEAQTEGDALYGYALRHGLDAQGFAIDECDRRGRQVRTSRRAWPQTELIKAYLNRARGVDAAEAEAAGRLTLNFLSTYLATEVRGLWMDQFDADGRGMAEAAPASTLYHVVVAFRELLLFAEEQPRSN